MKYKFILNPIAEKNLIENKWPMIKAFFDKKGVQYEMDKTRGPGHATLLASRAADQGFSAIIAMGGDGTANEIINGIFRHDIILGVIPCGGGNDYFKMLDLHNKTIEEACNVIVGGYTRKVDVGEVNGRYFLNMVGIGFDAEVAERRKRYRGIFRGFLAYLRQIPPALLSFKPKDLEVDMGKTSLTAKALMVTIGNGRYSGGGFKLTPRAEIDDGRLDICLVNFPGKLKALWHLPKVPVGKHISLPFTFNLRTDEIKINSRVPVIAHVDGEFISSNSFYIKVHPRRLRVLCEKPI